MTTQRQHKAVGLILEAAMSVRLGADIDRSDLQDITTALRTFADAFSAAVERAQKAALLKPKVYHGPTAEGAKVPFEEDPQAQFLMRANDGDPKFFEVPQ